MSRHASLSAALLLATVALLGCGNGQDNLTAWAEQQRAAAQPKVDPIQGPQAHVPQAYQGLEAVSPFSDEKLNALLRAEAGAAASGLLAAESSRPKEELEKVPLDTLSMVGLLRRGNEWVALVRSGQRVYQVRRGNHMGQNHGRITAISENQITLREIVQDPAGEWVERSTTLQLQEVAAQ